MHFFQPLLGTEAVVCVALLDEPAGILKIYIFALGLNVGTVIAAHVRTLVVVESAISQRAVNNLHRAVDVAPHIGVLDAKNEFTVVLFCEKIGVKRGAQAADVQITRGAGRKSRSYRFHLVLLC